MSGDLVLFVYFVLILIGEGCVCFGGKEMLSVEVLKVVGLKFILFGLKEGLVFINGM